MTATETPTEATAGDAITTALTAARGRLAAAGPDDAATLRDVRETARAQRHAAWHISPRLQADAEELQRRAERALAIAVRRGQAAGTVRMRGESRATGKASPRELIGTGGTLTDTYRLADGISNAQFERALAAARATGTLSRRAIIHKLRGTSARPNGRPPIGRATPGPLPDFARDAAWELRRAVERMERVFEDDRYAVTWLMRPRSVWTWPAVWTQ